MVFKNNFGYFGIHSMTLLIMDMFLVQFDWKYILAGFLFYLFAYPIWSSKKRGKRDSENSKIDILELIVEFLIEFIIWFFRTLGRLFRILSGNKGDTIALDIDL